MGLPIGAIILASSEASLKILTMVAGGVVAKRTGLITPEIERGLASLVIKLFVPALVFEKLVFAIDPISLISFWQFPLFALILCSIGIAVGTFLAKIPLKETGYGFRWIVCMTTFSNQTSIPLSIIYSLDAQTVSLFREGDETFDDTQSRLVSYVMLFVSFNTFLRWGLGYRLMTPSDDERVSERARVREYEELCERECDSDDGEEERENHSSEAEEVDVERGGRVALLDNHDSDTTETSNNPDTDTTHNDTSTRESEDIEIENADIDTDRDMMSWVKKFALTLYSLPPPLTAAVLGILVGLCVPLRVLFFSNPPTGSTLAADWYFDHAPLRFLTNACASLGNAVVPAILVQLGAQLSHGPRSTPLLKISTLLLLTAAQLIIVPAVLLLLFIPLALSNVPWILRGALFVLWLETTMPTAIKLSAIATMFGIRQSETSTVLFYQYVPASISITLWLILILHFFADDQEVSGAGELYGGNVTLSMSGTGV